MTSTRRDTNMPAQLPLPPALVNAPRVLRPGGHPWRQLPLPLRPAPDPSPTQGR
ncbi:MAG: hypothetical protein ACKVQR_05700 [Aquabacterium sp.]